MIPDYEMTDGWVDNPVLELLANIGVSFGIMLGTGVLAILVAIVFLAPPAIFIALGDAVIGYEEVGPDTASNGEVLMLTFGLIFDAGALTGLLYVMHNDGV